MTLLNLFSALGMAGIGIALVIFARLSKRLGAATRSRPYYVGFYVGAIFVFSVAVLHALNAIFNFAPPDLLVADPVWAVVFHGLPALGITIGLYFAWRYWSWLLAERD
ncbi:MAG: hypothetical protein UZ15_CFX003000563 [Chloroflexi bacterium OLB15]|nr:MAG: hypothetical protein UZ15_CFX003000563 [Chloroflexi bacterium OLB15]